MTRFVGSIPYVYIFYSSKVLSKSFNDDKFMVKTLVLLPLLLPFSLIYPRLSEMLLLSLGIPAVLFSPLPVRCCSVQYCVYVKY